ncbi:MAG: DUF5687 family protein [Ignavibacteriales bacterium]|nr:DUF5687 family protein [Ignavibacteriales bacterium]
MIKWLIQHNWLSLKRSPDFQRKVVVNIFFGLMFSILFLEFLLLGYFLNKILKDTYPTLNPLDVFNGALIFYFGIEFMLRLFFQKLRSVVGKHYLLLNTDRKIITHFILFKTFGTTLNILPLLIIIPFFFTGVLNTYSAISSSAWFISILSLIIFNCYFTNYIKMSFFKNSLIASITAAVIIILVFLEKMNFISFSAFSTEVFGSIITYPYLVFIPVLAVVLIYIINYTFLFENLYLENLEVEKKNRSVKESFTFLKGFGDIGNLISLDLKLMMRNKRAKITLWMPALFIFYGLLIYPNGRQAAGTSEGDFMMIFVGTFITGFFIMSYGLTVFSYESKHFGLVNTNNINMFTYLKSKYYFMLLMSTPIYLVSIFYVYYGINILIINSLMFVFNIGVTSFFFLFLATFNKIKFDLGADIFSWQGKGSNQFLAVIMLMLMVAVIYVPIKMLISSQAGFLTMAIMGLLGFIFHNQILNLLLKQFQRRKYIMSEGFRQT